jgi:hypothetical protein
MSGHIRGAIGRLDLAVQGFVRSFGLPTELPTASMIRYLGAADAAPNPPPLADLDAVWRRLHQVCLGDSAPHEIDVKDLRRAPWVFWHGQPVAVTFPSLLDQVVTHAQVSPRTLRFLIEAWLRDYARDAPKMSEVGLAIQRLLTDNASTRMDAWRKAHSRFQLFDAESGPMELARVLLTGSQPVATILEEAGFNDPLRAVSSYLKAVQQQLLARMAETLRGSKASERTVRAFQFISNGIQLRFDDQRVAVTRGLMAAWDDGKNAPPMELQEQVKNFLVERIGNPQIRSSRWVGAEKEAALVRRWLARASLRVFFGLIADHALDTQWRYREAFWLACLDKGAIDDAWLVLGEVVHASARARQSLGSAFGRLTGGRVSSDQSVLLLRIGSLVVAEWSHNGKMRAWKAPGGPKLWQGHYTRDDLTSQGLQFPADPRRPGTAPSDGSGLVHAGAASGTWQRRAARLLAQHSSIVLTEPDWRLR